jgi:hypothetical protein
MGFLHAIVAAVAALAGPAPGDAGFQAAQRDGVVVFSQRVGDGFRLVAQRGRGAVRPLPVAPSAAPFDVEVARDPRRGPVVAFARCQIQGSIDGDEWERRRCRLGVVDADGRGGERPLGPAARTGISHRFPALQGGRLAYVRVPDHGGRAQVVVDGRVAISRAHVSGPDGLYGLDLARYGIAAAIEQARDDIAIRNILLQRPGEAARVVASGGTGEENDAYAVTPAFAGPYLYWGYANHGWTVRTKRSYVFRRELASGTTTGSVLSPYVTSIAVDAGRPQARVVVTTDNGLDSPQRLDGVQAVRILATARYRLVPRERLSYP